jgi:hypothetical protein
MTADDSIQPTMLFWPTQGRCRHLHDALRAAGGRGLVLPWADVERFCGHPAGCCWEPLSRRALRKLEGS